MIHVVDRGEVGALVLLDISAAFDTVDHRIMADVLNRRFDVRGDALAWFVSYFDDRITSLASLLSTGVPQESVLGPRSYVIYADYAQESLDFQRVMYHLFADDMQGHVSAKPRNAHLITSNIQKCNVAVSSRCSSKRLQLNTKKAEVLWFGSEANLRQVTRADRCLTIGPDVVEPVEVVRNLESTSTLT